jgi:hypothetical protein
VTHPLVLILQLLPLFAEKLPLRTRLVAWAVVAAIKRAAAETPIAAALRRFWVVVDNFLKLLYMGLSYCVKLAATNLCDLPAVFLLVVFGELNCGGWGSHASYIATRPPNREDVAYCLWKKSVRPDSIAMM